MFMLNDKVTTVYFTLLAIKTINDITSQQGALCKLLHDFLLHDLRQGFALYCFSVAVYSCTITARKSSRSAVATL